MAFYSHKILILIIYHFYGFLWLRTNPEEFIELTNSSSDKDIDKTQNLVTFWLAMLNKLSSTGI